MSNYRDDDDVQTAVRNLFVGCVPEREQELEELWRHFSPMFQLTESVDDGDRIVMKAGAYRYVRFNHRVLRAFWIAGYAAWEGYSAVQKSVAAGSALDLDRFRALIAAFQAVVSSDSPEIERLPAGVAAPGMYVVSKKDVQGKAASELATISGGWALLHEIRHIQHQQQGTGAEADANPEKRWEEELSCDAYATHFLLERIDDYARTAKEDLALVRRKRQLGVYFALFALTLLAKGN
jgi:Peptidase U49